MIYTIYKIVKNQLEKFGIKASSHDVSEDFPPAVQAKVKEMNMAEWSEKCTIELVTGNRLLALVKSSKEGREGYNTDITNYEKGVVKC
jgi:hypothetical protein